MKLIVIASLLTTTTIVAAQPTRAPGTERHGVFFGGTLTAGEISCDGDDCGGFREAGGLAGHIGFMIGPRFGLLFDAWAQTSSDDDVALTFITATVNARLWLADILWVQGGIGSGHARLDVGPFAGRSDNVPVGMLAVGVELVRSRNWALDLQAKLAQGSSTDDDGDEVSTGRSAGIGVSLTYFATR
jgi:hypothetical protein